MLDEAFKRSRKFLGVPVAILLVVLAALVSGSTALAYYVQTANIPVTVNEPLEYDWTDNWTGTDGNHIWEVTMYACEAKTKTVLVYNHADVDVPIRAQADTSNPVPGVNCLIYILRGGDGELTATVPAHGYVTVEVTITASCDMTLKEGSASMDWTLRIYRGTGLLLEEEGS